MRIAYFDCFAGAGGDMIVAAMLDAGLDAAFLGAELAKLGLPGVDIKVEKTTRAGLRATTFEPLASQQQQSRNLQQIEQIIQVSGIAEKAKQTAIKIFERLAGAEGLVHGKERGEIHFHEVGSVDSIADIVSACIGIETMGIEKGFCSPLHVGGGVVKSGHGVLPVPAPATAELLKAVPIEGGPAQAELLTPTAAAILTTIADEFGPLPEMRIERIGYGAGSLDLGEFPNVLRLITGTSTTAEAANADTVCLLETNLDDASGELVGSAVEELFAKGALDVFSTPIVMKQARPGIQLSVLCRPKDARCLEQSLFEQGLTFGIRRQYLQRSKLARAWVTVRTAFGEIRVKTGLANNEVVTAKPEFSDCASAAKTHNVAVKTVIEAVLAAYRGGSAAG